MAQQSETEQPGGAGTGKALELIAFGSCNRQYLPQPLWETIGSHDPELWIWMGDNIYADTTDMELMRRRYRRQLDHPGYREFVRDTPVIGTWDDHDYGRNNAGKEYPRKETSQELLLDFLGVPKNSPRRTREGVYASYTYGPPGKQIKIILLDTRYHRDRPHSGGDILGKRQWSWLEEQLRSTPAQLNLIVSSIQVVAEDHPHEKWANFPESRERLFDLIKETRTDGVLLLSGDRHIAEISRHDEALVTHPARDREQSRSTGYPLYDITSSGLTHTWGEEQEEYNRHRVGELVIALNFGLMRIDWSGDPVTIDIEIRGRTDRLLLHQRLELSELQFPAGAVPALEGPGREAPAREAPK